MSLRTKRRATEEDAQQQPLISIHMSTHIHAPLHTHAHRLEHEHTPHVHTQRKKMVSYFVEYSSILVSVMLSQVEIQDVYFLVVMPQNCFCALLIAYETCDGEHFPTDFSFCY